MLLTIHMRKFDHNTKNSRINAGTSRRGAGGALAAVTPLLFRKLSLFAQIKQEHIDQLRAIEHSHGTLPAGADLIRSGQPYDAIMLLNEGWAARYLVRGNGRRQVANFILPGDFMCLNAIVLDHSDYDITAVTPISYSQFRIEDIIGLVERQPVLCAAILWCTSREEAILLEHLVSLGRRTAFERVAHLLIELWRRLQILGLTDGESFEMPLTQELIGDCLGLTSVHVNRMMRTMQAKKLIACEYRPVQRCRITDLRGLEEAAGFEDGYLHFTQMPQRSRQALLGLDSAE